MFGAFLASALLLLVLMLAARSDASSVLDGEEQFFPAKIKSRKESRRKGRSPEATALEAWAHNLTPKDYNYTEWRIMYHSSSTVTFFNEYAKKLSKHFKEYGAKINFAMIGACDGTADNTIKNLYLPNDHWRGVFVEPMTMNVRDLIKFMADRHASHRSFVIHAACTAECENPTLMVERPLYEEKNKSIPHWLRRQIGSVLPKHRDHPRKEWTLEEVRCVTADDILTEWAASSGGSTQRIAAAGSAAAAAVGGEENVGGRAAMPSGDELTGGSSRGDAKHPHRHHKRRPHVLKIDVEGHDYEVLMSFLSPHTPAIELPLLIDFEAKSIAKKFPLAKERMEQLGYVVSPFGQDGFAILTENRILESVDTDPRNSKSYRKKKPSQY